MAYEIEKKTLSTQFVVSVTRRCTVDKLDAAILEAVDLLQRFVEDQGAATDGTPFGIFHGAITTEADGPIEICVPTSTLLTGTGVVTTRTVEGGQAAFVSLRDGQCAYPEVLNGYRAVSEWMKQNGYEAVAPPREEWAKLPDLESQMDVFWLYREKQPV